MGGKQSTFAGSEAAYLRTPLILYPIERTLQDFIEAGKRFLYYSKYNQTKPHRRREHRGIRATESTEG